MISERCYKTLFLLCDTYPYGVGEFFIDDELRVLAPKFERVLVLTTVPPSDDHKLNRFVPKNAEICTFSAEQMSKKKLSSWWRVFSGVFWREMLFMMRKLSPLHWLFGTKVLFAELHRANRLARMVACDCGSDVLVYSYWHDYKALALALLKRKYPEITVVARAHGWDVFANRQKPAYLPFKSLIIDSLTQTYSISQAGKDYFEKWLGRELSAKVAVSRLGKLNERQPLFEKSSDEVVICSCSNLIPVKRVDKIIAALSFLKGNVRWIHFGDGVLMEGMKKLAYGYLSQIRFEFRGVVSNSSLLDFYAANYVDLFINLSNSEGIPVSIMEAESAGIPVLATAVGGTPEAIPDGVGFLVTPRDEPRVVAQVIKSFLALPMEEQQAYRRRAYRFWQENYNATNNYESFYNQLCLCKKNEF